MPKFSLKRLLIATACFAASAAILSDFVRLVILREAFDDHDRIELVPFGFMIGSGMAGAGIGVLAGKLWAWVPLMTFLAFLLLQWGTGCRR